ncbi:hypothetical protein [Aliivibrio fischeri]|uniref:hypothetical protein n=1 Tax=Aliivibrio fischeri TaxID=668 RepID=UPI0002F17611|nr:hypothetical protein [Aliivibrio fischeri]MUJ26336.1 hypothetical protein [Aliivibrio fischeri]OEE13095.1 hypothetical protein A1Q3_17030 [Aliivibrio fischeri ZF-211]
MGDWYDYFEDFPEENPANWVNGTFNPKLAQQMRDIELKKSAANEEAYSLIKKAQEKQKIKEEERKAQSLLRIRDCPQCGFNELNVYCFSKQLFRCECQDCGIYGSGKSEQDAYKNAYDALGEGLDWRSS